MDWLRDGNLRSFTATSILLGLLVAVVLSYWARGFEEAERLYGLLQGVVLGAFGWLYGSHSADKAQRAASEAEAGRLQLAREAEGAEDTIDRLEREVRAAQRALVIALQIPEVRARVEKEVTRMAEPHPEEDE